MNAKVTKTTANQTPKLDYADQPIGTDVIIFTTKCEKEITANMQDVLAYVETAKLNVSYEWVDNIYQEHDAYEMEVEVEPALYLDDNFEKVTQLYFDQVITLTLKEASQFIQGYAKSLVMQDLPVDAQAIATIQSHVRNEYGISMEVA